MRHATLVALASKVTARVPRYMTRIRKKVQAEAEHQIRLACLAAKAQTLADLRRPAELLLGDRP